jgi:hypothetical protein
MMRAPSVTLTWNFPTLWTNSSVGQSRRGRLVRQSWNPVSDSELTIEEKAEEQVKEAPEVEEKEK